MTLASLVLTEGPLAARAVTAWLCALRLMPIVLLCPLFGGPAAPSFVRLASGLSLTWLVSAAMNPIASGSLAPWNLAWAAARELSLGTALGLLAALPFEAARTGGRLMDLFRGTSAEAALPFAGSREAASGELLFHLTLSLASTGAVLPWVVASLLRSFKLWPLGAFRVGEATVSFFAVQVGGVLGLGLSMAAPLAAVSLGVEGILALASRAAPQLGLHESAAPLRILAGGAIMWLGVGLLAERWVDAMQGLEEAMGRLAEGLP